MYIPKSFEETDLNTLHQLMGQHNFASLITVQPDGLPIATHLPFLLDSTRGSAGTLLGHMARANPQWRDFEPTKEVLVIFQGPHTYISPSWYEIEPSVPTWDYAVVHVYGKPRLLKDYSRLHDLMEKLVQKHEATFAKPWSLELPSEYEHNMMQAIVGFEIEITRLEGKFKLSQNRSHNDQQGVIAALATASDPSARQVAELMSKEH